MTFSGVQNVRWSNGSKTAVRGFKCGVCNASACIENPSVWTFHFKVPCSALNTDAEYAKPRPTLKKLRFEYYISRPHDMLILAHSACRIRGWFIYQLYCAIQTEHISRILFGRILLNGELALLPCVCSHNMDMYSYIRASFRVNPAFSFGLARVANFGFVRTKFEASEWVLSVYEYPGYARMISKRTIQYFEWNNRGV
jgi:hypothetical protein